MESLTTTTDNSITENPSLSIGQAVWLLAKSFLIIMVAFIAIMLPIAIITKNIGSKNAFSESPYYNLFLVVAQLFLFGYAIWKGKKQLNLASFSLKKFSLKTAILLVLAVLSFGFLMSELVAALHLPDISKIDQMPLWTKIVSGILLAPLLEELLFRGIILEGFLRKYSVWTAIIASGIIFGIIHFNPAQTFGAAIMGIGLGWVYYRTKSLLPCIFIHFVNNLTAFLPSILTNLRGTVLDNHTIYAEVNNPMIFASIILALAATLFFALKALDKELNR